MSTETTNEIAGSPYTERFDVYQQTDWSKYPLPKPQPLGAEELLAFVAGVIMFVVIAGFVASLFQAS